MIDPARDVAALFGDGRVWNALAFSCLAAVILLLVGTLISRRIGLLDADAPIGESLGVGLSVGLIAVAAWWATAASGGGSVFVPPAMVLLLAIALGKGAPLGRPFLRSAHLPRALAAAGFLIGLGLLFGATMAPSPLGGLQPIEFFDNGFYAVLGADLAKTGIENFYTPSGFEQVAGLPAQTWYHWGELWLAAAAIDLAGATPMHARHLVVLPILLLAAATMGGTLVSRLSGRATTEFFLLGGAAILFLGPIPISRETHFEWWARGLTFSITQYGLAVIVVLLGIYVVAVRRPDGRSWRDAVTMGAIAGALLASHIAMAAVTAAGMTAAGLLWALSHMRTNHIGAAEVIRWALGWWRVGVAVVGTSAATLAWGMVTGHGLGALFPIPGIDAFDPAWLRGVVFTALSSGVLLAAPIAWVWLYRRRPLLGGLALGATVSVVAGALVWGARFADYNMFHLYYGAIAVVLTPVSAIVALSGIDWARRRKHRRLATAALMVLLVQTTLSASVVVYQLTRFGYGYFKPIAVEMLDAMRALPEGSKMAYSCEVLEVFASWDASLVSLDAHTGVRLIPMCFIADRQRALLGRPLDSDVESPYFVLAPQRALYPDAHAHPTLAQVRQFLATHGIDYIYADVMHPNTLVADGVRTVYRNQDGAIYQLD